VVTAICDSSARPAAITRGHGDAMERAYNAAAGQAIDGLELVELGLAPQAFAALRKHLQVAGDVVTVYDLFPLAGTLSPALRNVAGQFLAAEALWTLEEQGMLSGVPFSIKFDAPRDWDVAPEKLHERLVAAGALELSPEAIETFKTIKTAWDASGSK